MKKLLLFRSLRILFTRVKRVKILIYTPLFSYIQAPVSFDVNLWRHVTRDWHSNRNIGEDVEHWVVGIITSQSFSRVDSHRSGSSQDFER
jgi:hypothetical protein